MGKAVRTPEEYAVTDVVADGQVILDPFNDGITFEVVPGFLDADNGYTHLDSSGGGRWREANPQSEIEVMRERNNAGNGNLIQPGRMLRAWKPKWSVPIGGLLIDTLAYQFIETWEYRPKSFLYYDYMSRDCFKWMAEQSESQEYWKVSEVLLTCMVKDFFNTRRSVATLFPSKP